ncbi:MAG: hypothetical protein C0399_09700 [Syntrophus sp. (in: bacteria)]|nr:hypothetical protein [Syntrophus sp. (in: bacteria)]
MGQKIFNGSLMSFTGYYPTREAYESGLLVSSFKESAGIHHQTSKVSYTTSPQCLLSDQTACEFQDYCNHLYYINDRCCCASSWKKMTGLVLPTSE